MTTPTAGSRAGALFACLLLFGLGLAALGLAGVMNYNVGRALGADADGRTLYGLAHVLVDSMALALAVASGMLWARQLRSAAGLALVLALGFGCYSLAGLVGYGASQRVAVSEAAVEARKAAAVASLGAERRAAAALEARRAHIAWLQGTGEAKVSARDRVDDRREFLADVDKRVAEQIAAIAAPIAEPDAKGAAAPPPDASAMALARLTGADPATVQLTLVLLLSTLLVVAKLAGPWLAARLWPMAPPPAAVPQAVTARPSLPQPLFSPAPAPIPAPLPAVAAPAAAPAPARAGHPHLVLLPGLGLPPRPADPFEAFLYDTRKSGGGPHFLDDLWTAYARFCTAEAVAPLDVNTFAKLLTARIEADLALPEESQEGWHKYRAKHNGQRLNTYVLPPLAGDEMRRAA